MTRSGHQGHLTADTGEIRLRIGKTPQQMRILAVAKLQRALKCVCIALVSPDSD
jgi:hypothetical protein